jgi:hypothetical protein
MGVINFMPWPLYTQEGSSWYSLDRRLGRFQNRFGHGGEEINSQPLPEQEPPIIQSIAQCCITGLCWVLSSSVHVLYKDTKFLMFLDLGYCDDFTTSSLITCFVLQNSISNGESIFI